MKSLADLFKDWKPTKTLGERAELIKFFSEAIGRTPKLIGILLAHYSVSDLYALKSAYSDRLRRNGEVSARKYFWYITKTHEKNTA